jgi:hypothetical protein
MCNDVEQLHTKFENRICRDLARNFLIAICQMWPDPNPAFSARSHTLDSVFETSDNPAFSDPKSTRHVRLNNIATIQRE